MNKTVIIAAAAAFCIIAGGAGGASYLHRKAEQRDRLNSLTEEYMQKRSEELAAATQVPEDYKQYTVYTDSFEVVQKEPSKDDPEEVCKAASGSIVEYLNEEQNGYMKVRMIGTDSEGWLPSYALKSAFQYKLSDLTIVDADSEAYTYDEYEEDIKQLAEKYPYYAAYDVIGKTAEGRNIYDLVIGNTGAEASVLITAGERGSEIITSILLMKQAEYYAHYAEDGLYDDMPYSEVFDKLNFHIVAMMNPDGLSLSLGGADSVTDPVRRDNLDRIYESDRLANHGANIRYKYFDQWEANTDGVDVSKNFPVQIGWDEAQKSPSCSGYMGEALSSPEASAVWDLFSKHNFKCVIEYRTVGSNISFRYNKNYVGSVAAAKSAIALAELSLYDINSDPEPAECAGSLSDAATYDVGKGGVGGFIVNLGSADLEKPIKFSELQLMWLKHREGWMAVGKQIIADNDL